jgi:2-dehydropantoate 2-reductase
MAGSHIVIAGAGAIGCFVGGLLAAAGHRVTLLARPRVIEEITIHGLTLTDFSGMHVNVDGGELGLAEDVTCLSHADLVLVTVKSGDTADIADVIKRHALQTAPVISLQNGLTSAVTLKEVLPERDVRPAMVPFNVVPQGQGVFHRATSGDIVIGDGPGGWAAVLTVPHLAVTERADIEAVQWGKFLINLNNALNALSGLPLQEQLRNRDWRRLMADQWAEALRVLRAQGIAPASTTPVSVGMIPWILRLPTWLFTRVAASMLTIDAAARTSMSHDLMAHKPTEIDALQGEVVRRGMDVHIATPINAAVLSLVAKASNAAKGLPCHSAKEVRQATRQ